MRHLNVLGKGVFALTDAQVVEAVGGGRKCGPGLGAASQFENVPAWLLS